MEGETQCNLWQHWCSMKHDLVSRVSAALFDSDLIMTRLSLAMAEALWAILLWWPGTLFVRPAYAHMAVIMPEQAWGLVFALSAITQLSIVLFGHCHRGYARVFAGWNAVLWWYAVFSIFFSVQPPPAAVAGELTLAACAAWVWWRPILLCMWNVKAMRAGGGLEQSK